VADGGEDLAQAAVLFHHRPQAQLQIDDCGSQKPLKRVVHFESCKVCLVVLRIAKTGFKSEF
jgi:hypothetical protein